MLEFYVMTSHLRAAMLKSIGVVFLVSSAQTCYGQSPLTQGTVVTGQCNGHGSEPACVLPNLFGSNGLTLVNNPAFPHYAHLTGSAQNTLNQTLSTAIATQLAILPLISPASGFTYKYDSTAGAFTRTTSSFGPIYSERAETIGKGGFSFGVSYQRFRFQNLDGIDLHKIPAVFNHIPNTGPGGKPEPYEADVISTTNSIDLNMDQTLMYGTVGITNRIDVSVAIPIVSVRMGATSAANIIRVSGPTFATPGGTFPNPHEFDTNGATYKSFASSGSAVGIGDVTFRGKGSIFQTDALSVALAVDIRTPTGDAKKLLGSGALGVKPFLIVSGRQRLSPHLNAGYEWNGKSILAGNVTGTTFSESEKGGPLIQNGPSAKAGLPNLAFYTLGADYGVTSKLTLAVDYLGQTLIDTPRVFLSSYYTANISGGTGTLKLPTITQGKDTIGVNSAAVGLKYNIFNKLLFTADVLFRLDNRGLRQDVTPLVALSYAFGQ